MKIYTATGDQGETTLLNGERLSKGELRLEVCGTFDELSAQLGMLRSLLAAGAPSLLEQVQQQLFRLGGVVAAVDTATCNRYGLQLPGAAEVAVLEREIDELAGHLPPLDRFILPGANVASAQAHICRTVCRRAERRLVALQAAAAVPEGMPGVAYLNRLGDYLFLLARTLAEEGEM